MNHIADTIIRPGNLALRYTEALLKDIKPEIFARKPRLEGRVLDINHPAFCLGHLALYPQRTLALCGQEPGPAAMPEHYTELFAAGKECRDDAEGTIYPAMNEITERYFTAYRHLLESLATISDDILVRPNPAEGRMKEMFPTVAGAANFTASSHILMHLGQISAWRRCFNLGPAM